MKRGYLLVLPSMALIVLGVYWIWTLAPVQYAEYLAQADYLTEQGYFHTLNHPYRVYYPYVFTVFAGILGILTGIVIVRNKIESDEVDNGN